MGRAIRLYLLELITDIFVSISGMFVVFLVMAALRLDGIPFRNPPLAAAIIATTLFMLRTISQIPLNLLVRFLLCKRFGFSVRRSLLSGLFIGLILLLLSGTVWFFDIRSHELPTVGMLFGIVILVFSVVSTPLATWIIYSWRGEVFESRFDKSFVNPKADLIAQGL
ncbi:hypothetical protein HH303_10520 [Rhodospirillaceae bacterium KN72]|uniref:Uncharacterized protein n=1 Tax=Pacificispira spongiicola TaxID=2729598 RepID=A0A7Y0E0B8_9PROT|nr:hypothetical protein [Pacificispira spongiicola]NMM44912.1 hypothetical protein [Pacificispira spongiicola]